MVENRPKGQALLCGGEGMKMRDNWGKSTGKPPEGIPVNAICGLLKDAGKT